MEKINIHIDRVSDKIVEIINEYNDVNLIISGNINNINNVFANIKWNDLGKVSVARGNVCGKSIKFVGSSIDTNPNEENIISIDQISSDDVQSRIFVLNIIK